MGHYLRVYRVIGKTFGCGFGRSEHSCFSNCDKRFQRSRSVWTTCSTRGHRKQPIDRPIFIIGNPRSGTTFLHRLLARCRGDGRFRVVGDVVSRRSPRANCSAASCPRLDRLSPARYHPSDVHDTSLRGIETDDVAWFFRTLDGPFAWAYFLAWQDNWGSELVPARVRDRRCDAARQRSASSATTRRAGDGT